MCAAETAERAVFSEIRKDYGEQLRDAWERIDWAALGLEGGAEAKIPMVGLDYLVSPDRGFSDAQGREPSHAACVALAKYLLINAGGPQRGDEWVSYKQFPDAAAFVEGFGNTVERRISRVFTGRRKELAKACVQLGGRTPDLDLSYDLVMEFQGLPRVPLLLLFNDEEDPFPAQCSVLLREDASRYLDMECLAILGMLLTSRLCARQEKREENGLLS